LHTKFTHVVSEYCSEIGACDVGSLCIYVNVAHRKWWKCVLLCVTKLELNVRKQIGSLTLCGLCYWK